MAYTRSMNVRMETRIRIIHGINPMVETVGYLSNQCRKQKSECWFFKLVTRAAQTWQIVGTSSRARLNLLEVLVVCCEVVSNLQMAARARRWLWYDGLQVVAGTRRWVMVRGMVGWPLLRRSFSLDTRSDQETPWLVLRARNSKMWTREARILLKDHVMTPYSNTERTAQALLSPCWTPDQRAAEQRVEVIRGTIFLTRILIPHLSCAEVKLILRYLFL